jgi:hypothetical protein
MTRGNQKTPLVVRVPIENLPPRQALSVSEYSLCIVRAFGEMESMLGTVLSQADFDRFTRAMRKEMPYYQTRNNGGVFATRLHFRLHFAKRRWAEALKKQTTTAHASSAPPLKRNGVVKQQATVRERAVEEIIARSRMELELATLRETAGRNPECMGAQEAYASAYLCFLRQNAQVPPCSRAEALQTLYLFNAACE